MLAGKIDSFVGERLANVPQSRPILLCSSSMEPLPMPSCSRPAEIWSSVVAIFASTAGWRNWLHSTMCPTWMRSVRLSSAVARVHASIEG